MTTFKQWLAENNHFQNSEYIINGQKYNVPKLAKWAEENLKPTSLSIEEIQRKYINSKNLFIDVESGEWVDRSMMSDLKFPILIFKQQNGMIDIIDGNHRTWKAWKTGIKDIRAYVLDSTSLSYFR